MARYWLGPWQWITDPSPHWAPPAGSLASLDLRSIPQCAQAVTPSGLAIFITPDAANLGADYTNLGTDPLRTLTEPQKRQWESALALPQTLAANRLRGIIWETLTLQSDPIGDDRCLPLIPTTKRRFEVWLAGQLSDSKDWSAAGFEHAPMIDLLKRMYRRIRQASLDGKSPPDHYRKWLGFQVRKFANFDYHNFIASDLPDEEPIAPTTTITESFNTADSTTLGPDQTWTEYEDENAADSWEIATNAAKVSLTTGVTHGVSARAESDLSSDDHYSQVAVTALSSGANNAQIGSACRFSASAATFYGARALQVNDTLELFKMVNGVLTVIGSGVAITISVPHDIKTQADGSTIKSFFDAAEKHSVTDTAITGNTRCGIFGYSDDPGAKLAKCDDFEAADLAAPPAGTILPFVNYYQAG